MSFENKVKVVRGWRKSWLHMYKRMLQERTDETLKDTDAVDMKILDMLKYVLRDGRCKCDALYIKKWSVKTLQYKELITSNIFHFEYKSYEEVERAFNEFIKDIRYLFQMESDKFVIINRLIIDFMGFVVGIDEEDEKLNDKIEVKEYTCLFMPNINFTESNLSAYFNMIYKSEDKYYLGHVKTKDIFQNCGYLVDVYKFYDVREKGENTNDK
jgi:hypothetical protein